MGSCGVGSTLELNVKGHFYAMRTCNESTLTVNTDGWVIVDKTGYRSKTILHAGGDVTLRGCRDQSQVIGTYEGSKDVDKERIGEDSFVDLNFCDVQDCRYSSGSTITVRMVTTCILLILVLV